VEHALFHQGLIHYNLNELDDAKRALNRYIEDFPEGKFRENALSILQKLSEK
jgi:TolA-binding protein